MRWAVDEIGIDRVVHVSRFQDQKAAQHFLGFGKRAVRGDDFAVFPAQDPGASGVFQHFAMLEMAVLAQYVVIVEALVD
jgi:hypothetical protein